MKRERRAGPDVRPPLSLSMYWCASMRRVRKNACARSSGVAHVSISAANAATGSA